MTATCATCQSWSIKTSWLKVSSMAPCDLSVRYTALRPDDSCTRHRPVEPVLFAKREKWLAGLDLKNNKGMT